MLKVLLVVSANHYIGIWPEKTPMDVQVKCSIHHHFLYCNCLFLLSISVTKPTKDLLLNPQGLLNQFDLSDILCYVLMFPLTLLAELSVILKIYILFPYVFCCLWRQQLDKCLLPPCFFTFLPPFFQLNFILILFYICTEASITS
jgi:hypothetical protein